MNDSSAPKPVAAVGIAKAPNYTHAVMPTDESGMIDPDFPVSSIGWHGNANDALEAAKRAALEHDCVYTVFEVSSVVKPTKTAEITYSRRG